MSEDAEVSYSGTLMYGKRGFDGTYPEGNVLYFTLYAAMTGFATRTDKHRIVLEG